MLPSFITQAKEWNKKGRKTKTWLGADEEKDFLFHVGTKLLPVVVTNYASKNSKNMNTAPSKWVNGIFKLFSDLEELAVENTPQVLS